MLGYISQKEGINCRSATKDNLLLYISTELEEIRKVQGQLAKVKLNIIKTEIDDFLKIYQTLYMQKQREGIEDPMLQKCLFLVKQSDFFNKEYYELCLPFFIDKVHNDLPKDASELLASNGIKSVMDQKLIDQSYVQLINGVREPLEMVQGAALQLGKDLEILEKIKMQLSKKLQSKKKPKSQINSRTIMVQ